MPFISTRGVPEMESERNELADGRDHFHLQILLALSVSMGDLLAGKFASLMVPFLPMVAWVLVMYPPVLTMRGNTSGVLSGRLSTGLHTGLILPQIFDNTEYFYGLISSILLLSLINAILIGSVCYGAYCILTMSIAPPLLLLVSLSVSLISMISASLISIVLNTAVAIESYRRALDPDVVVYPVMSTINDILVTLIYVSTIFTLVTLGEVVILLMGLLFLVTFLVLFMWKFSKYWKSDVFRDTLKEVLPLMVILALLSNVTGSVLMSLEGVLKRYPEILIIYPVMMTAMGDEGAIFSSITTTRLALGYTEPSITEFFKSRENLEYLSAVFFIGLGMFAFYGIIGTLAYSPSRFLTRAPIIVFVAMMTQIIAFCLIIAVSLPIAIITFKKSLDPDNFVIPVIASSMDLMVTSSILLSTLLLAV